MKINNYFIYRTESRAKDLLSKERLYVTHSIHSVTNNKVYAKKFNSDSADKFLKEHANKPFYLEKIIV